MGYTTDQLEREKDLKKFLQDTETTQQSVVKQQMAGPSALFQGPADVSIEYGESFREDTASLGKKKTWKPSDDQQEKNKRIQKSLNVTERATAYTLELKEKISERQKQKDRSQLIYDPKHIPDRVEEKLTYLLSVKFEKRMLTSANIRANLGEYLNMIDAFGDLVKIRDMGREADGVFRIAERLQSVEGPMKVLTERVESFLGKNRLTIDGKTLPDDVEPREFVFTSEKEREFTGGGDGIIDRTRSFDPATIEARTAHLDKGKILALMKAGDSKDSRLSEYVYNVDEMSGWDSVQRIEHIEYMREYIADRRARMRSVEDRFSGNVATAEMLAGYRREILETQAVLCLAEAEAAYIVEQNAEAKKVKLKIALDAEADYRKVLLRSFKLSLPGVVPIGLDKSPAAVTREEALNSHSDTENYAFKRSLADAARAVDSDTDKSRYTAFRMTVFQYTDCTHYTVGPEEETRRLKELIGARKSFQADDPLFKDFDDILAGLLKTSDSIPDWKDIPEGLRVDAIDESKLPEGASLSDLTPKQLGKLDRLPEETSAGKEKGSHRNAILTGFRTWKDLDADTPLFSHEPTINDLRQGKVSNCYMLASTTGLINLDPQIIKDCIKDNGDGTATVRLYKPSERTGAPPVPVFVRIPKRVPKLVTGGDILSSGAIWMQLIERAAAQVGMFRKGRGGYQSLWYGTGDEWLAMLTGTASEPVFADEKIVGQRILDGVKSGETPNDSLFEALTNATANQLIFHAGTKDSAGPGMNSGHAYTVLGTKVVGKERFVVLRNPYANMSRVETDDGVTKSTSFTSSVADVTCGQFAMPYEEFLDTMKLITLTDFRTAFRQEHEKRDNGQGVMTETDRVLTLKEIADLEASGEGRLEDMIFDDEELDDLLDDQQTEKVTKDQTQTSSEGPAEMKKEEKGGDPK